MAEVKNNYVLGRGKVYFDRFITGTRESASGERYTGNSPEFATTSSADTLDHYSSDGGMKVKDESVDLQVNRSGTFTVDNINLENMAMFFSGEVSTVTQASVTGATETRSLHKGNYFQLGQTLANPSGVRQVSNLVVATTDGTPATIAAEGNYELDAELGRLYILGDSDDITDGDDYTLTYDIAASTMDLVLSQNDSVYGAIRFIADNAVGENRDFYLPYVKLSPNGDYALKGDDWQVLGFNMEILKRDDNTAPMYINGRAKVNP